MKALISIIILVLVKVTVVNACAGFDSPEFKELVAASNNMKKYVKDDLAFSKIREKIPVELQQELNGMGMEPINFSEQKHLLDYQVLGDIEVDTFSDKGKPVKSIGSAIKIGKSCIVTSAHTLYESLHQKLSDGNKGPFDKSIKFNRGHGEQVQSFNASVFFQMTKPGTDFVVKNGMRVFHGHNDLVVLKLNNHSDPYFKKINVMKPSQVRNNSNPDLGKEMTCQG